MSSRMDWLDLFAVVEASRKKNLKIPFIQVAWKKDTHAYIHT